MTTVTREVKLETEKLTSSLKGAFARLIQQKAEQAQKISTSDNPHTPIITVMQMVYVQACTEYLVAHGIPVAAAVNMVHNSTTLGMRAWLESMHKSLSSDVFKVGEANVKEN